MTLKLSLMRWVATLVGVQLLCGIVWVLGPLLAALETWPARLSVILSLILAWAAANLLLDLRRGRLEAALVRGAAGEAGAVGAKLTEALTSMRRAKGRRFRLNEQPWYAIIGPPGAGKTTALLNAGLTFPLAGALGPGAVAGVGGTRLCDWWFTEDAVLIDTAGRYTTQDSDRAIDRAGWDAFLDLLRRTRPAQPLNGVIVAIALNDIAGDPALLETHARAIRARIDELEARLGVRMPVYALFTKVDLLVGFSEFFDDLDRAGRAQIWGATFPIDGAPDLAAAVSPLLDRLNRRTFARLDAEAGPERRVLIAGFPNQLASVLGSLQSFVTRAFGPVGEGAPALLRGVYLVSGTQEGTPIDRLMGTLSRAFGLSQRRAAPLRPEAGRGYFLTDLFRTVVFREANLVGFRPDAARRRRIARVGGFVACAAVALAGAAFIFVARQSPVDAIGRAQAAISAQQAIAARLPLDPVGEDDLAQLTPWLDAAAAAALVVPSPDRLGFAQDDKLAEAGRAQYRHALDYALLPRLVWRAETQMRGLLGQVDALYDATRMYLMLGGAGPMDRALVEDWFGRDLATTLPGEAQAGQREDLTRHLHALLSDTLPAVALDGPLIARARETIGRVPLAARAWSRLKPLAAARATTPWRPASALGPAGVRVFVRPSGRGLEEGVPGLYTLDGLRNAVMPNLPLAAVNAAGEGWVVGEAIEADSARRRTLEADILALYAAEYMAAWDTILADLDPAPLRSLIQAAQDLYILASAHSPIQAVLASAAAEASPDTADPSLARVSQHFAPLRALFGAGGAVPIDLALRPLGDLQQQLAKQAATTTRPIVAAGEDPAAALRAEALRQPAPLGRWLAQLATSGAALRDGGPRGMMIAAWNASGGPGALCSSVLANHYPFVTTSSSDASIDDFTRLLAPGGALNSFFNVQLKPYVDMAARPWRLQPVDGVNAAVTAADLAQFQRAAAIRDLYFPGGSAQPLVRFDVTPGGLDAGTSAATLDFGIASVTSAAGAVPRPVAVVWPGRPRAAAAHLALTSGTPVQLDQQGQWAAFRLIGSAKATSSGDRTTLTFVSGDRTARFELRASPNPFTSTVLTEFRCPTVQ